MELDKIKRVTALKFICQLLCSGAQWNFEHKKTAAKMLFTPYNFFLQLSHG